MFAFVNRNDMVKVNIPTLRRTPRRKLKAPTKDNGLTTKNTESENRFTRKLATTTATGKMVKDMVKEL